MDGGVLLAPLRGSGSGALSAPAEADDRRRLAAGASRPAALHVCTVCRRERTDLEAGYDEPGRALLAALEQRLDGAAGLTVAAVECLAVCKRPCTVALSGPGRWTYLVGDLTLEENLDDLVAAATAYAATENGIIPWRERPIAVRRGTIARVPPFPAPDTE